MIRQAWLTEHHTTVRTNIVDQTVPLFDQARHDLRLLVELVPDNQFWKVSSTSTFSCLGS